jgi:hypothetical protein
LQANPATGQETVRLRNDTRIRRDIRSPDVCVGVYDTEVNEFAVLCWCWSIGEAQADSREEHTVDALASGADEGRGQAAKGLGEPRAGNDPRMSEWGNPTRVIPGDPELNT